MDTLNVARDRWENVRLTQLQTEWDQVQIQIAEYQSQSVNSRKTLATSTKEFKNFSDEDKLKNMKNLLKSYQKEIDNLTQRTKFVETNWIDTVNKMAELPDPSNLLGFATEEYSNVKHELEITSNKFKELQSQKDQLLEVNVDLQADLNDMKTEQQSLLSQVKLYEELKEQFDTSLQQQLQTKEAELQQEYELKFSNFLEREKLLKQQIKESDDYLINLKENFNQNQVKLLEQKEQESERHNLTLHQLNLIKEQNEETQMKLIKLRDENKDLKSTIQKLKEDPNAPVDPAHILESESLKVQLHEQEDEINKLVQEIKNQQNSFSTKELNFNIELKKLKDNCEQEKLKKQDLESKLNKMDDYSKIKMELGILKSIEFPEIFTNGSSNSDQESFDLMASLRSKNNQLHNDLTSLKQTFNDLQTKLEQSEKLMESNQSELKSKSDLIQKLELDLLQSNQSQEGNGVDDQSGAKNVNDLSQSPTNKSGGDAQMVTIITGQRDRFRHRNLELEEDLNLTNEKLKDLNLELNQLKFENLKLFEKLKYQNQFQLNNNTNNRSLQNRSSDTVIEMSQSIDKKYEKEYEMKNNPFQEFHHREQIKRYRQLHPVDRLVLNLTKLLTMNRYTRFGLLGYIVLLHLLVFFTAWHTLVLSVPEDSTLNN